MYGCRRRVSPIGSDGWDRGELGQERFYLLGVEATWSGPQLFRRWRRRHWIEFVCRVLKHLLTTEGCQVHSEDTSYGHLVLRLMASFVLFYTSRVICKGRLTMEGIIFSLKHYWRFVDLEALELQARSQDRSGEAAWRQANVTVRKTQLHSDVHTQN